MVEKYREGRGGGLPSPPSTAHWPLSSFLAHKFSPPLRHFFSNHVRLADHHGISLNIVNRSMKREVQLTLPVGFSGVVIGGRGLAVSGGLTVSGFVVVDT